MSVFEVGCAVLSRAALYLSVPKKSVTFCTLKIRHIFCENKFSRKISLRSSKSPYRTFLMAIIQLEAGLFSLRLGHGAALTCHRHVIHSRAAASLPLKLPRCAVIFPQQHRFFDSPRKTLRQKCLRVFLIIRAARTARGSRSRGVLRLRTADASG